jgi:hypothetical protein
MLDTRYWIKKKRFPGLPASSIQEPVSRNQYKELRTHEYRT